MSIMTESALLYEPGTRPDILYLAFNPDSTFLTIGTTKGFLIYLIRPFQLYDYQRCGEITIIEMLSPNELVALVGSNSGYDTSSRCLIMWHLQSRTARNSITFHTSIYSVKMNPNRIIVALADDLRIYDLKSIEYIHRIDHHFEFSPQSFVCCLSSSAENGYLVIPASRHHGRLNLFDTYNLDIPTQIEAHTSPIKVLSLNRSGTMLASASVKGTIIRVWTIPEFEKVYTFRRSVLPMTLYQISFSASSQYITSTGSSGSVYIFKIDFNQENNQIHNSLPTRNEHPNHPSEKTLCDGDNKTLFESPQNEKRIGIPFKPWKTVSSFRNLFQSSISSIMDNYLPSPYKEVINTQLCKSWLNLGQPSSSLPSVGLVLENPLSIYSEIFIACHAGCAYLYNFSTEEHGEARIRDEFILSKATKYEK